jgi:hypothetical protein
MTDDRYPPPEQDKGDTAYAAGRALLSAIPVAGGAAVELFQFIITPPIEKRRNDWMKEIGQAVQNLEQNKGVAMEELKSNDVFIDTLLQASQIALRNSQEEKREALKNAVLNVALPDSPEQALIQVFLEWIDIFTVWHLKILSLIDEPEKHLRVSSELDMDELKQQWLREREASSDLETGGFILFLEAIYPELNEKKSFYPQIVRGLYAHGLISIEDLRNILWDGILVRRSTELGVQFLRFIENPS